MTKRRNITAHLVEKIEGEAKLQCTWRNDRIARADILFPQSRYIEKILQSRPVLDALAINPRVCGICGHAHLIATVRAVEACYPEIELSRKAETVREITLALELFQNHIKWFYLTLYPLLGTTCDIGQALTPVRLAAEAIALLAGQYPHNSYALPGGITANVTPIERYGALERVEALRRHMRSRLIDADVEELSRCEEIERFLQKRGDIPAFVQRLIRDGLARHGRSHDRFIVWGESGLFTRGKAVATRVTHALDPRKITERPIPHSKALWVDYRGKPYETGPLARAMVAKVPLIKEAHRRWGDSVATRIMARLCEMPRLLEQIRTLLRKLDTAEAGYLPPPPLPDEARGVAFVEAARGSLMHEVHIREGRIAEYRIVTPTQWNLGSGPADNLGVAQKALLGLHRDDPWELVFKSFDVCSVCTTH